MHKMIQVTTRTEWYRSQHTQNDTDHNTHKVIQATTRTKWYRSQHTQNDKDHNTHKMIQVTTRTKWYRSQHAQNDTGHNTYRMIQITISTEWYRSQYAQNDTGHNTYKMIPVTTRTKWYRSQYAQNINDKHQNALSSSFLFESFHVNNYVKQEWLPAFSKTRAKHIKGSKERNLRTIIIYYLCFVPINSILLKLLCVRISSFHTSNID